MGCSVVHLSAQEAVGYTIPELQRKAWAEDLSAHGAQPSCPSAGVVGALLVGLGHPPAAPARLCSEDTGKPASPERTKGRLTD